MEREVFDGHDFHSLTDVLKKAFTSQLDSNSVRKITTRHRQSPWDILQQKIPSPHPRLTPLIDAPLILSLGQNVPGLTAGAGGGGVLRDNL